MSKDDMGPVEGHGFVEEQERKNSIGGVKRFRFYIAFDKIYICSLVYW